MIVCVAPVEKFRDYIFKPGATNGKDHIFRSLGYDRTHSKELATLYEQQAATQYTSGNYSLGKPDKYGQRVNIEIELVGVVVTDMGKLLQVTSYLVSGWMIEADGSLSLNTPFSGFSRKGQSKEIIP